MGTTHGRVGVDEGPSVPPVRPRHGERATARGDGTDLRSWTAGVVNRHAAVGLVVVVVGGGSPAAFAEHGFADLATARRIDADTVLRVGSVTKLLTAVAVMQLHEQGRLDLDAPAGEYLRGYALVPARPSIAPPTLRHLLTHTAGIAEVQRLRDLLQPGAGPFGSRPSMPSAPAGRPLPTLAEYYRQGLPVVAEPGTTFAYTNHGYATLGQVVEDVSGVGLDRYLREHVFGPLGMVDSELARSPRTAARRASGYVIGRHGVEAVPDRDWLGAGSGGAWSTPRDLARFAAAVLGGGADEHGRILERQTLATMLEPRHRPDPRMPGWGLGFARRDLGGHRVVGHDGVLPGFHSAILVAPDDDLAVLGVTNGSPGAFVWLGAELEALLRRLLHAPVDDVRGDVPQRPETWSGLCGTYRLPPRVSDLRGRVALAGGAEVLVRGGRLVIRARAPVPALRRGVPLHPDDAQDPDAFRMDLSALGMPSVRLVAERDPAGRAVALHADLGGQPLSLVRRDRRHRG